MSEQPESKPGSAVKELTGRIGKYEILKPLGRGAMGMVYLAHDTVLERDVALKVMVAQIADDPELNQRFVREAKAVARMTHPNVVAVFDLGNHIDGSPYIAMELLRGMDLQKAMRTPPAMSLDRKVAIIVQVLAGLAHAHQAGIVHRDIKPANIFINTDGTVKIMDFGVARLTSGSMTGTGNIVGTADYMSPEQVKGAKVDGRSDLFSVGCMLYELLAGRRPFHSDNLMAIFYKITHEEPDFSLMPQSEDHAALMPLLQKSLAKSLDDRYQSAYDFAVDLREYLKSYATSASGEHALEGLLDLERPTHPPQPITDVGGPTFVPADTSETAGATMGVGATVAGTATPTGRPGTGAGRPATATTLRQAAGVGTVVGGGRAGPGTVAEAPTVHRPPRPEPRAGRLRPAPAQSGSPVLYIVLGGMAVALLGTVGFIYMNRQQPPVVPQATPAPVATPAVASVAPPTTLAEVASKPPPPTAAPPPTFGEAKGKGAAAVRAAQAAFKQSDYNRAVTEAQAALREDPGNRDAKQIAENALNGQKADSHFQTADSALRAGDLARAASEAETGRTLAPWDGRARDLIMRVREAEQRAQQQAAQQRQTAAAAQVNNLLAQADAALGGQKYDQAIALYDQVLQHDPQNSRASVGKTSAVGARAVSLAAAGVGGGRPAGKGFATGKTVAQSGETRSAASAGPEGFEDTAGVVVKRGTQSAELPGKISFDIDPDSPKPGEKYTVKIYLSNEGNAPIQIRDMLVSTRINGRLASGPVPPMAKDAAPQQKVLLLSLPDLWKEDTSAWSMEVQVRTVRGESYKNQVVWK